VHFIILSDIFLFIHIIYRALFHFIVDLYIQHDPVVDAGDNQIYNRIKNYMVYLSVPRKVYGIRNRYGRHNNNSKIQYVFSKHDGKAPFYAGRCTPDMAIRKQIFPL